MRLKISKKSRIELFEELKKRFGVNNQFELSKEMDVNLGAIKKWKSGKRYIPSQIIPKDYINKLEIVAAENDNWGARKGGIITQNKLKSKFKASYLKKIKSKGGKRTGEMLQKWIKMHKKIHSRSISIGRYKKSYKEVVERMDENKDIFENSKEIFFDNRGIVYSNFDKYRKIILPNKLTPLLAEEIGMHIGDGTLPNKKYYFSIRGSKYEKKYFLNFVLPLYKRLFNLHLNLLERGPICGIEFCSKAVYSFKSKVLGLPIGKKAEIIKVPDMIKNCQRRDIFESLLRGIFDTDGCIYLNRNKSYPHLQITIKSNILLQEVQEISEKLGFFPALYSKGYCLKFNGPVQIEKWFNEIGSNNFKHLKRFEEIRDYFVEMGLWGSWIA